MQDPGTTGFLCGEKVVPKRKKNTRVDDRIASTLREPLASLSKTQITHGWKGMSWGGVAGLPAPLKSSKSLLLSAQLNFSE